MSDGEFKLAQLRLGRIYPIKGGDTILEPDEARINLVGQIYLTWGRTYPIGAAATALEPDGGWINSAGQIYLTWGRICLTWAGCQASGIR
jgi:hypothetical protein